MGHIVIISGSPGVGKSTIAKILSENSPYERTIHIHTDDFYGYIRKGYIEPWRIEAGEQNDIVIETIAVCAKNFAKSGYEVFVDGVIGSWFLEPWIEVVSSEIPVHYAILRPTLEVAVTRNANREKVLASNIITQMWNVFADLGSYESHVINTTNQNSDESAIEIRNMVNEGCLRI